MMSAVEMYYRSQGIWPTEFHCRHRLSCSEGEPAFTPAKASFIGAEYERGRLPRLLFLSLDSGDGSPNPEHHTLRAVREVELRRDVSALTKTQHWYLTHRLAAELLSQFDPSLTVEQMATYFAHVNTAKCSVNRPGRREAPPRLAANCRAYLPGELAVLRPDILVTQGAKSRDAIRSEFVVRDVREWSVGKATGLSGVIHGLTEGGTLWLATHHPSAYGAFWPQQKEIWPVYRQAVGSFIEGRRRP